MPLIVPALAGPSTSPYAQYVFVGDSAGLTDGLTGAINVRDLSGVALPLGVLNYIRNGAVADIMRAATRIDNIAAVAITAGTPATVRTPASGKTYRVLGYALSLTVAGSVIIKYGAGSTELLRTPLMAAGVGLISPPFGQGFLAGVANDALKIDATATGSVSGYIIGTEE